MLGERGGQVVWVDEDTVGERSIGLVASEYR
jgi:hypothetical protein